MVAKNKKKKAKGIMLGVPEGYTLVAGEGGARRVYGAGEAISDVELFEEVFRRGEKLGALEGELMDRQGDALKSDPGIQIPEGEHVEYRKNGVKHLVVAGSILHTATVISIFEDKDRELALLKTNYDIQEVESGKLQAQVDVLKEVLTKCATSWGE